MPKGEITLTRKEAKAIAGNLTDIGNIILEIMPSEFSADGKSALDYAYRLKQKLSAAEDKVCMRCNGTGGTTDRDGDFPCPICFGTGKKGEDEKA